MSARLLVCRISWMDRYRGVTATDTPTGGGSWVRDHGFGHEAFNFAAVGREFFGFVQAMGDGINLARLGGRPDDSHVPNVTVAWVATHPREGGTRLVGWYEDATVFSRYQPAPRGSGRLLPDNRAAGFVIRSRNAVLLDRHDRVFEIPRARKGQAGMGQSNVWYPDEEASAAILRQIALGRAPPGSGGRPARPQLQNVERRLRIERTAMSTAATWFAVRGYAVKDVSMDRLGWDLEASRRQARLLLEVKGTSLSESEFVVEVTPNEYAKMTTGEHRAQFRICVVTSCEASPELSVFAWSPEASAWTSDDGSRRLEIQERIAARLRVAGE